MLKGDVGVVNSRRRPCCPSIFYLPKGWGGVAVLPAATGLFRGWSARGGPLPHIVFAVLLEELPPRHVVGVARTTRRLIPLVGGGPLRVVMVRETTVPVRFCTARSEFADACSALNRAFAVIAIFVLHVQPRNGVIVPRK